MLKSLPIKPKRIKDFPCGLFIMSAPTKGGKSLYSLAISEEYSFDFLYVNEPRSKPSEAFGKFVDNDGLLTRDSFLAGIDSISNKGMVIDSIGDLFHSDKKDQGLGKGLTFEQQLYLKKVQRRCLKQDIVLIGTVNSNLVPAIEAFEGTTEGFIVIASGKVLSTDRDSRMQREIVLSHLALDAASIQLGYGEYKRTSSDLSYGTFSSLGSLRTT